MTGWLILYALVWVIFVIITIINGAIREAFISPTLGSYTRHVISTIIAIVAFAIGTYIFMISIKLTPSKMTSF